MFRSLIFLEQKERERKINLAQNSIFNTSNILLTFDLIISLYTFRANIELALNNDESEDDITAALTAPRPIN